MVNEVVKEVVIVKEVVKEVVPVLLLYSEVPVDVLSVGPPDSSLLIIREHCSTRLMEKEG